MPYLPTREQASDLQVKHAVDSFRRGVHGFFLCNWQQEFVDDDLAGWDFFERNAAASHEPAPERKVTRALFVSSWDQYFAGKFDSSSKLKELYERLTEGRTRPVDIVNEGVFLSNPQRLDKYTEGVWFSQYSKHLSDAFGELLGSFKVPFYSESGGVGSLDPYGAERPGFKMASF